MTGRREPFTIAVMRALLIAIAIMLTPMIRAQEESPSPAQDAKTYPEVPKQYEVGEDTISPDGPSASFIQFEMKTRMLALRFRIFSFG